MPRFRNPGSQESFVETWEVITQWRLDVLSDLVWRVAPIVNSRPWSEIAEEAVAYYESNGSDGDPMFEKYSDNFISASGVMNRRADIRQNLASNNRFLVIEYGPGGGIRKARSDAEIAEHMRHESSFVENHIEKFNYLADLARDRRGVRVPTFRAQLTMEEHDES